jgi:hypothetical protein
MIDRAKVIAALERKRAQFQKHVADQRLQGQLLEERLAGFLQRSAADIDTILLERGTLWPGARPTAEFDRAQNLCLPFPQRWHNHPEAHAWARSVLTGHPVIAVDGSQIAPSKEYSVPVGAVQVGWFINDHSESGRYVKDVEFEVITPGELGGSSDEEGASRGGDGGFPTWYINQQRFVRECRALTRLVEQYGQSGQNGAGEGTAAGAPRPVCLFDGSFVISFAGQMLPERARPYLEAVAALLEASKRCRVPVVAYVDTTFSRDVVNLIATVMHAPDSRFTTDAALLHRLLPRWGDRSPLFLCARDDALSRDGRADFYTDVAFAYVRLAQEQPPARLEMPRWVLDTGMAEQVIDIVRAECVVGMGYPYAIETADALAVISHADRERFHALFEQFAQREGIDLRRVRKAQSKLNRRA